MRSPIFLTRQVLIRYTTLAITLALLNPVNGQNPVPGSRLGYTKGEVSVNNIGAAAYNIPIKVAPGVNGLQPKLLISYSSNGGNGPLGLGFSIQGLSVISRTSRTYAQDVPNPLYTQYIDNSVNFNLFDRYSLDGEQIRPAKNIADINLPFKDYGKPGTVYYTEQNSFQNIILVDTLNGSPTYFKVFTKDGLIKEYGNSADSRIELQSNNKPLHWFINKLTDRNGNYIQYDYYEDSQTGQYYPVRIKYTGNVNAGRLPSDSLVFIYEDRPDSTKGFLLGNTIKTQKRISRIISYSGSNIVRQYLFTYSFDGTFSMLSSIRECISDNNCLDPVNFSWGQTSPQYDLTTPSNPISSAILNNSAGDKIIYNADFDGDGLQDVLVFKPFSGNSSILLNRLNTPAKNFQTVVDIIPPQEVLRKNFLVTDFNADGKADLYFSDSASQQSLFYLSNFSNDTLKFVRQVSLGQFLVNNLAVDKLSIIPQDLNNDGLTDLSLVFNTTIGGKKYQKPSLVAEMQNTGNFNRNKSISDTSVRIRNTDLNFTTLTDFTGGVILPAIFSDSSEILYSDFDNNLFPDKLVYNRRTGRSAIIYSKTNVYYSSETEKNDYGRYSLIDPFVPDSLKCNDSTALLFYDFNGDKLPDLLYYDSLNTKVKWWVNKGNFTFEGPLNISFNLANEITTSSLKKLTVGDYNFDGLLDLCIYNNANGNYKLFKNAGNFNFSVLGWLNPLPNKSFNSNYISLAGVFNVNSNNDFLIIDPTTGNNEIWSNRYIVSGNRKLYNISEGSNRNYDIIYSPIHGGGLDFFNSNNKIYKSKLSITTYPTCEISSSFEVVQMLSDVHPALGIPFQTTQYSYEGARISLNGRGFRGFSSVTEKDVRSGRKTVKEFYQDTSSNIFVGDPLKSISVYQSNGRLISRSDYQLAYKYFPVNYFGMSFYAYTRQNISTNYEADESIDNITRTKQEIDDFGNVTVSVTDFGNGYKDSVVNQYNNDTASWILGRLTSSTLYRIIPNKPAVIKSCSFEYNPVTGQLEKEVSFSDLDINQQMVKGYSYDDLGNIIQDSITAWNGAAMETRTTKTFLDSSGKFIIKKINPVGHVTLYRHDYLGNTILTTNEDSLSTRYVYDDFGRLSKTIYPDSTWEKIDYVNYNINLTTVPSHYNSLLNSSYVIVKQFSGKPMEMEFYDYSDRHIGTEKTGFSGKKTVEEKYLDSLGRVVKESRIHYEDETPQHTFYSYDSLGRQVQSIEPGNRVETVTFSPNRKVLTNARGQTKTILLDSKKQVIEVKDNNGKSIFYDYDASGNLLSTTDPKGNKITYSYDLRGYKIAMTDPDMGTYTYEYNGFGELIKQVDPKNSITTIKYDLLGRITQKNQTEGSTFWYYDSGLRGTGKLSRILNYNGSEVTYIYDSLSRLSNTIRKIDNRPYSTTFRYDNLSRIKNLIYPSGFTLNYSYNTYSYLFEIRRQGNNFLYWRATKRNAAGMLEAQLQQNNVLSEFFYNPETLFIDSLRASNSARFINRWRFSFDKLGNLLERQNVLIGKTEAFELDNLNRLTKAGIVNDTSSVVTIAYDELGNITSKSDVGTYEYGGVNNGPHRLIKVNLFKPRCIPSLQVNYDYSSFNKVTKIFNDTTSLSIFYDYNNQRERLQYRINDSVYRIKIYVGDIYEIDSSNGVKREIHYIRGSDGVVATYTLYNGAGKTNYWFKDHLNSLTLITDSVGNTLQQFSYDAWGNRRNYDWTTIPDSVLFSGLTDRGFTGHEHYDLFSLVDMNGRIYDPVLGRFISPDPFIQDITNLQNFNRYSYVLNNPLSYTDPSGYFFKSIFRAVGSFFRAIGSAIASVAKAVIDIHVAAAKWVKENWKSLVVVAVAVGVGALTMGIGTYGLAAALGGGFWGGMGAAVLSGAAAGFASSFTGGVLSGQSIGDALKSGAKGAAIGALSAGLTYGVGSAGVAVREAGNSGFSIAEYGVKVAGHGVVQGGITELNGGKFIHGFYSGAISGATSGVVGNIDDNSLRYASAAAIGGTTSAISGGSFVNGAVTGAFVMMFNDGLHRERKFEEDKAYDKEDIFDRKMGKIENGFKMVEIGSKFIPGQYGEAFRLSSDIIDWVGLKPAGLIASWNNSTSLNAIQQTSISILVTIFEARVSLIPVVGPIYLGTKLLLESNPAY